ncbi:hypothetical protein GOP47_0000404 [Adiantum capillus-veneris]|uniref:Tetratricopeptide repeat protein 38 n=1 Tax=Adiantum capillus-veneris TaxID=13818 RepID=A0A9D4ZT19_ADICA|nr:hypothetical protein GOP47_0000404 [Adiantum capillus-veneris]
MDADPRHQNELVTHTSLDLWGHSVHTASVACIQHINSYYQEVLAYGSNQKTIFKAVEEDCNCALAHVLSALHSLRSSTDEALSSIQSAKRCLLHATSYEKMALIAAEALVAAQWEAALAAYSTILDHYPKDLFSLKRAQVLCFYMGKCEESLRLSSKVLPSNKEEAYIHGMHAFALLETRRFAEAERAARKALMIRSTDKWAQHALCHVLQYRCLFPEVVQFMEENKDSWSNCCSFMYSHNWWHLAVSYLEWGCIHSLDKVFGIYDSHLWPAKCQDLGGSVQALLSALGLLLRLHVRGFTDWVQMRIQPVAQQVCNKSDWHKERLLDLLMIWALAYVNEYSISSDFVKQLTQRVSSLNQTKRESLKAFLKLSEGLYEYGRGNLNKVFDVLGPNFRTDQLKVIGASDEQLDIFEELWCLVALRTGHFDEVHGVLQRRISVFRGSPFSWELMAEFYEKTGSPNEAQNAIREAESIRKGYLQFKSQ